jgi:SAM-dependent methyltransferase
MRKFNRVLARHAPRPVVACQEEAAPRRTPAARASRLVAFNRNRRWLREFPYREGSTTLRGGPIAERRRVLSEGQHRFHHHDESARRKWQDPEAILADIGLSQGDTFVDVGCGDGFFALPAARIVGKTGSVLCIDIDEVGLGELRTKAEAEGLYRIDRVAGEAETTLACEACADFVFFGINLHDFRDQDAVLANALKMIKPSGLLVDLDWKNEPMEIGPPLQIRFSVKKASGLIEKAGFIVVSVTEPGPMHYMITARPAGGTAGG